jgi:hypothetical protein
MQALIIRDQRIGEDANGNLNLTDIWRLAGSPSTKTTSNWRGLPTTEEYIVAVAENLGKSYVKAKNDHKSVVYSKTGRGGGAFGHILVAIGYAEYLNPDLAVEINATYLRVRSGDIPIVGDVLRKADAAREFQESRDISKQVRHKFESTLTAHGAKSAIGYITNAIYQVLLGGTKQEIVAKRGLPANVVFRDKLPLGELLQTINTEFLASERIEGLEITGKEPCAEATRTAAGIVKDAFSRAVQPEKP